MPPQQRCKGEREAGLTFADTSLHSSTPSSTAYMLAACVELSVRDTSNLTTRNAPMDFHPERSPAEGAVLATPFLRAH